MTAEQAGTLAADTRQLQSNTKLIKPISQSINQEISKVTPK